MYGVYTAFLPLLMSTLPGAPRSVLACWCTPPHCPVSVCRPVWLCLGETRGWKDLVHLRVLKVSPLVGGSCLDHSGPNGENNERSDSERSTPYCITLGKGPCAEVYSFLTCLNEQYAHRWNTSVHTSGRTMCTVVPLSHARTGVCASYCTSLTYPGGSTRLMMNLTYPGW